MFWVFYSGTIDSSGMRIWYTDTPREHEAGIMQIGHSVTPLMVIPPNAKNFTVTGLVNDQCTNQVRYNCACHFSSFLHFKIFT